MARPQHMGNTRYEDQRRKMVEAERLGHCAFCLEYLSKYHDNPILQQGEHWILTANDYPYENAKVHVLAISRRHIETLEELDPAAGAELIVLAKWLALKYSVRGGALCMRFGEENYSGGTLPHIHAQFIVPDIESKKYEPISFWIGARLECIEK